MNRLLEKETEFVWAEECEVAFDTAPNTMICGTVYNKIIY